MHPAATRTHPFNPLRACLAPALALALLGVPSGATAGEKVDVAKLKLDAKLNNSGTNDLYLLEVRPIKLFYWDDEEVTGRVALLNNGAANATVALRVWLESDLRAATGERRQDVALEAFSRQTVDFRWPAREVPSFGHALKVEVALDGKPIASGEEYFSKHENVWAVGIAGGHPVAFTHAHVKTLEQVEQAVEKFRRDYRNTFEKFFWAPDDFAEMTPDVPVWFSGQARYHENLERLKHLCQHGLKIGVLPTTYGKCTGGGTAARDFIRAHPETIRGYGGVMSFKPDTEELAKWQIDSEPYWQSTAWASYNMNDPAVVQHGIREIIESSKQFGWAGVRFDGHFDAKTGKQRVGDRMVEFSKDDADALTAANMKALKDQARAALPKFVFGYNYTQCRLPDLLVEQPRETLELCEGGGHIMDEYAKANERGAHPYRNWAAWAEMVAKQAEQARRLGGHLFPMVSTSGPVGRYHNIFTYAGGAHPNGSPGEATVYNAFATRYAALLWHPDLECVWNPNGLVIVRHGVMWENYVRRQMLGPDRMRLIVHLVNPPAQESATDSQAAVSELNRRAKRRDEIRKEAEKKKEKPDYAELEALPPVQLYPDPQKDIWIRIPPQALKRQWDLKEATLLDPEARASQPLPVDRSESYFWQVVVPEVKSWVVVVFEFGRP